MTFQRSSALSTLFASRPAFCALPTVLVLAGCQSPDISHICTAIGVPGGSQSVEVHAPDGTALSYSSNPAAADDIVVTRSRYDNAPYTSLAPLAEVALDAIPEGDGALCGQRPVYTLIVAYADGSSAVRSVSCDGPELAAFEAMSTGFLEFLLTADAPTSTEQDRITGVSDDPLTLCEMRP